MGQMSRKATEITKNQESVFERCLMITRKPVTSRVCAPINEDRYSNYASPV